MKTINIVLIISSIFLITSCGTALRFQKDGDLKKAINISMTSTNKDIKVFQNKKELSFKLVYDGENISSPYMVRRYYLVKAPKTLEIEIEKNGVLQKMSIPRINDKPNFWIQGLWFFVDIATGATKHYDDLAIDE